MLCFVLCWNFRLFDTSSLGQKDCRRSHFSPHCGNVCSCCIYFIMPTSYFDAWVFHSCIQVRGRLLNVNQGIFISPEKLSLCSWTALTVPKWVTGSTSTCKKGSHMWLLHILPIGICITSHRRHRIHVQASGCAERLGPKCGQEISKLSSLWDTNAEWSDYQQ